MRSNSKISQEESVKFVPHLFDGTFPKIDIHPYLHDTTIRKNAYGYRSDEFTKDHDGQHILFSGCSVTFGDGLVEDEIWAKTLYNKVAENAKTSGFFNIGTPGKGICFTVFNILKYIDSFGKPDTIFINFPVPGRFYSFDDQHDKYIFYNIKDPLGEDFILDKLDVLFEYQYLYMLERFCEMSNITLVYGTWAQQSNFNSYEDLKYFVDINDTDKIAELVNNTPQDKFIMTARDGIHYGTAFHAVWAEIMYNEYMRRVRDDG